MVNSRPLLKHALNSHFTMLESQLTEEEEQEKQRDRNYWAPLRKEIEYWRHKKYF